MLVFGDPSSREERVCDDPVALSVMKEMMFSIERKVVTQSSTGPNETTKEKLHQELERKDKLFIPRT